MAAAARPRHLPTDSETLLIRAACLSGAGAEAAWQEWRTRNELAAISSASLELIPAIYRNLDQNAPTKSEGSALLRGAYRKAWIQNNMRFEAGGQALRLLAAHNIEGLVLKGAALTARLYHDNGVRPMGDVDVLVRLEDAEAAYLLLLAAGWRPDIVPGGDMARVLHVVRSVDLVRADGARLDLHWHVLADNCDPGDDDDFWAASEVVEFFDGLRVRTLCHTDLLLHAIVHGSKWSSTRSVLWVMDAFRIIAAPEAVDWARLIRQARQRSVSTAVLVALTWLRNSLAADVPEVVLADLSRIKTGLLERLNYRSQDSENTAAAVARREIFDYLNRTKRRPLISRVRGWTWYLQVIWGVSDARRLPYEVVRRLYRRSPMNQESRSPGGAAALGGHPWK